LNPNFMLRPFQIACVLKGDVGLKLLKTQANASFMKLAIAQLSSKNPTLIP